MLNRIRVFPLALILLVGLSRVAVAQAPLNDAAAALFDDTVIHDIYLTVNPRDWASLKEHFQDDTYYVADFRWRDQVVRNIGIRSRGSGSRRPDKPSIRLDFNRYITGQELFGLKSAVLRNNSQDASNMRERVAMLFFRRMGVPASREAHARMYVNNQFAGLFTIVEALDKDFLQKYLADSEGHLFKYYFDNAAVLAGIKPYEFQYLGSDPALYVPVPFEPKTQEDDPQGEAVVRLVQAINDTGAAWRQMMAEYLDLAKFVRHLAIENFLAEEDGITGDYGMNNLYFYRFANKNLFIALPWDKSNTFWDVNFSIFRSIKDGPEDRRNRLVLRAFQEPDLLNLYLDTMLECADAASSVAGTSPTDPPFAQGWLEREVNREYDQIHTAALTDTILYTNAQFEDAAASLKAIARDRSAVIRAQVAAARGQ